MKNPAFTLFEVLMAIGIVVLAVSVISNIQLKTLMRLMRDHDEIGKIFLIKRDLYLQFLDPPEQTKKLVNKLEDPEISITTQVANLPPKSSLAAFKDYLKIVQSQGQWILEGAQQSSTMITFVPKSAKERAKEKKK